MANKLRHFVRLDSKNKPVGGSNLSRAKKPKTGSWMEIFPLNCCNVSITDTPSATSGTEVVLTLLCNEVSIFDGSVTTAVANITAISNALNTAFSIFGTFSVSGTEIKLTFNSAIAAVLCPTQSLSMVITVS